MTLAQVADTTRIRATVIEAIENDDFAMCGGDVYARGHLKAIATAVGIDPVALAAAFDVQQGASRAEVAPVEPIAQPTHLSGSESVNGLASLAGTLGASLSGGRRGANWSAVMALALVIIVGVGAVSVLNNRAPASSTQAGPVVSSSSTPNTPSSGSTRSATPSATPTTPAPSTSPSDVVAAADSVAVKLTVTGRASWVRVTSASGKTLFEGTLTNGATKSFRDKTKVKLVIGDAGAVSLNVNSHDLGAPGSSGQVLKVEFGPGDPTNPSA
jgi:cytoskeletal protein RodZ